MEHKNIYQLVLAGVLCAIGLVVPMVMPKVIIGPMSFILGAGTVLHSVMDCSISVLLWKFVRAAVTSIKLIRG
ncbi:hypothetical protein [Phascolarctobacterium succinatutens]|uniref:hypothetical protein n=1 Tax=Phascolarctobacterium succinatutens TaxID=626940 RepID=UPI002FB68DC0